MKFSVKRKMLSGLLVASLLVSAVPMSMAVLAEQATGSGTPYTEEGIYDVTVPHVIINQVYGGKKDGNADHSFIELYATQKLFYDFQ